MVKKEIRKTVLWHESIKKAKTLMEIQKIRDDMVEEIRKDGLVTGSLEKNVQRILELCLLYLYDYITDCGGDDLAYDVIRLANAMLLESGIQEKSIWDLIFEEILDYREARQEKTENTEKLDWEEGELSSESYEILTRTLTLGALLRKADDEVLTGAIKIIKNSLLKFVIDKEQLINEIAGSEAGNKSGETADAGDKKEDTDKESDDKEEKKNRYREELKKVMGKFSSPLEIKAELDRYVVGQEHAKRSISMVLWHHIRSMGKNDEVTSQSVLLLGNTGSGKTMLAKKIAEISGLPCVLTDASRLTENGWRGGDMEDVFARLSVKGVLARYGIVIFDEFDKLVKMGTNSAGEDVGKERQSVFLDIMEGVTMVDTNSKEYLEYETGHILYIFTGAFNEMRMEREKVRHAFGFGDSAKTENGLPETKDAEVREELVRTGVLPEIVGRISCIEELSVMDEEEMYKAVTVSPDSELYKAKEYVPSVYEKELVIDEDYVRNVVSKMRKASLGVRGCNNYFRERIMELLFASYERKEDRITLTHM